MKRFIEWMAQALQQALGGEAARPVPVPVRVEASRPRRPRR